MKRTKKSERGGTQETAAIATTETTDGAGAATMPAAGRHVAVPIDAIDVGTRARQHFDETALLDLSHSMTDLGQLQPIVTLDVGGGTFRLISGERRLRALQAAGATLVEAMVYAKGSRSAAQLSDMELAENFQREEFTHIEIALALGQGVDAGRTVKQLAEQTHKSVDWVREHLDLLRLDEKIRPLVASGRIPVKQAAMIARVGDKGGQVQLAKGCVTGDYWCSGTLEAEAAKGDYVQTMGDMRKAISNRLKTLGGQYWPMDEPYARKQPCTGCTDNTATEAGLFVGINLPGKSKKGNCTNEACFDAKVRAWDKSPEKKKRDKAKAEKRQAAGKDPDAAGAKSGESYDEREKRGRAIKRRFPETAEQHLAVAQHAYLDALCEAICVAIPSPTIGRDALPCVVALAVTLPVAYVGLSHIDAGPDNADALIERLADDAPILDMDYVAEEIFDRWQAGVVRGSVPGVQWNGDITGVPLHDGVLKAIQCLEALARRWKVPFDGQMPTVEDIAADQIVAAICNGKRDEAAAAVAECADVATLDTAKAAGLKAKWRVKMVEARCKELAGIGGTGFQPVEEGKAQPERLCHHGEPFEFLKGIDPDGTMRAQIRIVRTGRRMEVIEVLTKIDNPLVLEDAEAPGVPAFEVWRKQLVAERIEQLLFGG